MSIFSKTDGRVSLSFQTPAKVLRDLAEALRERRELQTQLKVMTKYADQLAGCHADMVKAYGKETRCKAILVKHGIVA